MLSEFAVLTITCFIGSLFAGLAVLVIWSQRRKIIAKAKKYKFQLIELAALAFALPTLYLLVDTVAIPKVTLMLHNGDLVLAVFTAGMITFVAALMLKAIIIIGRDLLATAADIMRRHHPDFTPTP